MAVQVALRLNELQALLAAASLKADAMLVQIGSRDGDCVLQAAVPAVVDPVPRY